MLMSEEAYAVPGLRAALGRLANSVVAVLGPELSPGTDVYTKCKALIREVQVGIMKQGSAPIHTIVVRSLATSLNASSPPEIDLVVCKCIVATHLIWFTSQQDQRCQLYYNVAVFQQLLFSRRPQTADLMLLCYP